MKLCQLNDATVEALNDSAIAEVAADLATITARRTTMRRLRSWRKMKPLRFAIKCLRTEADRLGVRASTLDREVKKARKSAAVDFR